MKRSISQHFIKIRRGMRGKAIIRRCSTGKGYEHKKSPGEPGL
jgi:hypothetical protein